MQYRDVLIYSLTVIARRMRLRAALRELTRAACALASTLLVYQILAALIPAPAAASALKALLVLLFIGSIGFFAVRAARRITLAQAAAATDACADLKDELKTAYWFARQGEALPLIDLQIRRAVLALQKLHPNKLFTIAITRRAFAALGLALIAGWLAWFSPRLEYHPSSHAPIVAIEPPLPFGKQQRSNAVSRIMGMHVTPKLRNRLRRPRYAPPRPQSQRGAAQRRQLF